MAFYKIIKVETKPKETYLTQRQFEILERIADSKIYEYYFCKNKETKKLWGFNDSDLKEWDNLYYVLNGELYGSV